MVHYLVIFQSAYRGFYVLHYICLFLVHELRDSWLLLAGIIQFTLSAVALRRILCIHTKTPSTFPALSSKITIQLLHLLRFGQLLATAIAGYIYCYLVWSHNYHYCAWFPWTCTPDEMEMIKVPWPFIITIITVFIWRHKTNLVIVRSRLLGELDLHGSVNSSTTVARLPSSLLYHCTDYNPLSCRKFLRRFDTWNTEFL